VAAILKEEPPWQLLPAATPGRVKRLLRRCLEKDPKKRLRDIGDARIEIDETAASATPAAPEVPARKNARLWTLAVIGVLAVGLVATALIFWPRAPIPASLVVRSRMSVGQGLWPDGVRAFFERPTLSSIAVANNGSFIVYSAESAEESPQTCAIAKCRLEQIGDLTTRLSSVLVPGKDFGEFCRRGQTGTSHDAWGGVGPMVPPPAPLPSRGQGDAFYRHAGARRSPAAPGAARSPKQKMARSD